MRKFYGIPIFLYKKNKGIYTSGMLDNKLVYLY